MLKPSILALCSRTDRLGRVYAAGLSVCGGLANQRSPQSLRNAVVWGMRVSS